MEGVEYWLSLLCKNASFYILLVISLQKVHWPVQLICVLFQPLGSVRRNRDTEFNRFLSHTSPLCPVASHKHLLVLQRNLWSLSREYVAFISLRITTVAFVLLSGAWNASGIPPQVSSDNGTQILKRNEKPKLCKSTALSNSQFPFP